MEHRRDVRSGDLRAGAASSSGRGQKSTVGRAGVWVGARDRAEDAGVFDSAGLPAEGTRETAEARPVGGRDRRHSGRRQDEASEAAPHGPADLCSPRRPSLPVDCVHSASEIAQVQLEHDNFFLNLNLPPASGPAIDPHPVPLMTGRKFAKCLQQNAHWFSAAGIFDLSFGTSTSTTVLGNAAGGNDVTGLAFVFVGDEENAPESLGAGISVAVQYGFKPGLGNAGGMLTRDFAEGLTGYYEAKGIFDLTLTGALALDCALDAF